MRIAIFDIDGTLVRGSTERMFWRFLFRKRRQKLRQLLSYVSFFIRYLPTGGVHTAKKNKAYLCGLSIDQVLPQWFFESAVQRLRQHRVRGDKVVLMSGTLDCVARALGRRPRVDQVCATVCSQRNGVYTAQPPEIHPFDAAKLSLTRQIAERYGADLGQVTAYGDSRYDLFQLAAVGQAVAVCPDSVLSGVAEELGWEVMAPPAIGRTLTH
jgi:HAD superfamily phosphoserine phosphatase-like hydrolase